MQPVNRLHPEIITLCATFVSDDDPRPIIPLTHVCRYWRRTITSSPGNWASLSSSWRALVPFCLERAGTVPLAMGITVDCQSSKFKRDRKLFLGFIPHFSRTFRLSLAWDTSIDDISDDLPGFLDTSMPSLTFPDLRQKRGSFRSSAVLEPPLFQNLSKLKSLCLARVAPYPTIFKVSTLVELKLRGYEAFCFERLLELLRSNQNLESVTLDLEFSEDTVPAFPEGAISLPKL